MRLQRQADLEWSAVSHDPQIRKRVLVERGVVPKLTNFSRAVLRPGQGTSAHSHPDMFEVYLVEEGEGVFVVAGDPLRLGAGDSIVIEPGESHSLRNPSPDRDLRISYFGIEE